MPAKKPDPTTQHLPDYLPKENFVGLILGPPRSGKSHLIVNLVLRKELYRNVFDLIYLISPTGANDPSMKPLLESSAVTHFGTYSDELIDSIIADQEKAKIEAERVHDKPMRALIILDDGIGLSERRSSIAQLSTRYRHFNISILIASQVFREVSNIIRKNASFVIIYTVHSDKEMKSLEDEYDSSCPDIKNMIKKLNGDAREFLYIIPGHSARIGFSNRLLWKR